MQPQSTPSTTPSIGASSLSDTFLRFLRGLLRSLFPLVLVAGVVALMLLLEVLAGHAAASQSFFTQQQVAIFILILGLLAAVATYAVSCRAAVRQFMHWQRESAQPAARGSLVGLIVTALVVLLPVLLAVFLPQHPAP